MSTVTVGYTTPFLSALVVVIGWSRDVGLSLSSAVLTSCTEVDSCGIQLSQIYCNSQFCGQLRHTRNILFVLALFRLHEMFFRDCGI